MLFCHSLVPRHFRPSTISVQTNGVQRMMGTHGLMVTVVPASLSSPLLLLKKTKMTLLALKTCPRWHCDAFTVKSLLHPSIDHVHIAGCSPFMNRSDFVCLVFLPLFLKFCFYHSVMLSCFPSTSALHFVYPASSSFTLSPQRSLLTLGAQLSFLPSSSCSSFPHILPANPNTSVPPAPPTLSAWSLLLPRHLRGWQMSTKTCPDWSH